MFIIYCQCHTTACELHLDRRHWRWRLENNQNILFVLYFFMKINIRKITFINSILKITTYNKYLYVPTWKKHNTKFKCLFILLRTNVNNFPIFIGFINDSLLSYETKNCKCNQARIGPAEFSYTYICFP